MVSSKYTGKVYQPNILGLSGYCQSGKSTVGDLLEVHAPELIGRNATATAFADPMREMLAAIDGIPTRLYRETVGEEEYRRKMQTLGQFGRDYFDKNFWVDAASANYRHLRGTPGDVVVVFTDIRYPEEVDFIHKLSGDIWWISREGCKPVNKHTSELHYDYIRSQADRIIVNDGDIESLMSAVRYRE